MAQAPNILSKELLDSRSEKIPWSGCWIWMGAISHNGYGNISLQDTVERTHKVSYELYKGKVPPGLLVLHTCDIPSCINPEHLKLGTQQDNMDDAKARNRIRKGATHGRTSLTEEDAEMIRNSKLPAKRLAELYKVHETTIWRLRSKRSWRGG